MATSPDNNYLNLARGAYRSNNNKRVRKLSAFMPMRGRKDGRDDFRSDQSLEPEPLQAEPLLLGRDSDDASILRLIGPPADLHWLGGLAGPHQFASSLAAQQLAQQLEQVAPPPPVAEGSPPARGLMQAKLRRAFQPMRGKKSDEPWPSSPAEDWLEES